MNRKPKYLQARATGGRETVVSQLRRLSVTILLILFIAVAAQSLKARRVIPPPIAAKQDVRIDPPTKLQRAEGKNYAALGFDLRLESRGPGSSAFRQAILFQSGDDPREPFGAGLFISEIVGVLLEIDNQNCPGGSRGMRFPIHNQRFKNNWELSAARQF